MQFPKDKQLTVVSRIEAGCLGPDGESHIEAFCKYAKMEERSIDSEFFHWEIVPRYDKLLAETEYRIINKRLTRDQAAKYMESFNKDIEGFEEDLHERIIILIGRYLGH